MIDHGAMFDFYDGGGLDIAFLGLARPTGPENQRQQVRAKATGRAVFQHYAEFKKVFHGLLHAGADVRIEDGKVRIVKEGSTKRFVENVEHITSAAGTTPRPTSRFINNRAAVSLAKRRLHSPSWAGMIWRGVLAQMDFVTEIADCLTDGRGYLSRFGNGLEEIMPGREVLIFVKEV
jgi:propionate CoA-transferase